MNYLKAGRIIHFFDKIDVAVLEVTDLEVNVGDKIRIGEEADGVEQVVSSMQVEHAQVNTAKIGEEVGLKVAGKVRVNDVVYKIEE